MLMSCSSIWIANHSPLARGTLVTFTEAVVYRVLKRALPPIGRLALSVVGLVIVGTLVFAFSHAVETPAR
jgi:hypothetical protein